MEIWPSTFPLPKENLDVDTSALAARSRDASGAIQQRQRFPGQSNFADVSWELTAEQLEAFLSFHTFLLSLGADWFSLPLVLNGAEETMSTVRFVDGKFTYDYSSVGYWTVQAMLEIRDRVHPLTEEDLDNLLSTDSFLILDTLRLLRTDVNDPLALTT